MTQKKKNFVSIFFILFFCTFPLTRHLRCWYSWQCGRWLDALKSQWLLSANERRASFRLFVSFILPRLGGQARALTSQNEQTNDRALEPSKLRIFFTKACYLGHTEDKWLLTRLCIKPNREQLFTVENVFYCVYHRYLQKIHSPIQQIGSIEWFKTNLVEGDRMRFIQPNG